MVHLQTNTLVWDVDVNVGVEPDSVVRGSPVLRMAMLTKGTCLRNSNHLRTIIAFVASSFRRDALPIVALETLGPAGEPPVRAREMQ